MTILDVSCSYVSLKNQAAYLLCGKGWPSHLTLHFTNEETEVQRDCSSGSAPVLPDPALKSRQGLSFYKAPNPYLRILSDLHRQ